MLKVLELFGGIGACTKALSRLGIDYEVVDYVEVDANAVRKSVSVRKRNAGVRKKSASVSMGNASERLWKMNTVPACVSF